MSKQSPLDQLNESFRMHPYFINNPKFYDPNILLKIRQKVQFKELKKAVDVIMSDPEHFYSPLGLLQSDKTFENGKCTLRPVATPTPSDPNDYKFDRASTWLSSQNQEYQTKVKKRIKARLKALRLFQFLPNDIFTLRSPSRIMLIRLWESIHTDEGKRLRNFRKQYAARQEGLEEALHKRKGLPYPCRFCQGERE